jgi:hypothetical protein
MSTGEQIADLLKPMLKKRLFVALSKAVASAKRSARQAGCSFRREASRVRKFDQYKRDIPYATLAHSRV